MFAAQLGSRNAAFHLAQHTHDLRFCESCLLHRYLLVHPAEKILLPHPLKIGGLPIGLQGTPVSAPVIASRALRLAAAWILDPVTGADRLMGCQPCPGPVDEIFCGRGVFFACSGVRYFLFTPSPNGSAGVAQG